MRNEYDANMALAQAASAYGCGNPVRLARRIRRSLPKPTLWQRLIGWLK